VAGAKGKWLAGVAAYSVAGALAGTAVGAGLGAIGRLALPQDAWLFGLLVVAMLAVVAVASDMGWTRAPLLQPLRQTRDVWAGSYGRLAAAVLWGFDLGLVVTTRFTFAGVWVLMSSAVLVRDPLLGSGLLLSYWLGRTASVWIGPLLLEDATGTPQLLDEVNRRHRSFRSISFLGVGLLTISLLLYRIS
jgi:hypothetical protein